MKHLGIDFGERRVGIAISDEDGRFAVPLKTLERTSDRQVVAAIAAMAREERIEALVLGEPLGLDGESGAAAERARSFARKLERTTELPVFLVDEALTSIEAAARLREAGVPPSKIPSRIDAVAAQILLQEWLDREPAG